MTRQHIVFLTGAGISVESGLSTFRGKDGLWTNEEWAYLASTDALYNDTQRCLDFYNFRRKKLSEVEPNEAHRMIAELEKEHQVTVITQNVDNLHERAGSTNVIHLHGELSKVCSMENRTTCVKDYPLTTPIMLGDKAEDGAQLRPYIVMFGEYIDSMNVTIDYLSKADASTTYLSKADAQSTYATNASVSETYLSKADASTTYLSKADAATTYLTQAGATETYLSKADAATTYTSQTDFVDYKNTNDVAVGKNTDAIALLNNNVDTAGSVLNSILEHAADATYSDGVTIRDAIDSKAGLEDDNKFTGENRFGSDAANVTLSEAGIVVKKGTDETFSVNPDGDVSMSGDLTVTGDVSAANVNASDGLNVGEDGEYLKVDSEGTTVGGDLKVGENFNVNADDGSFSAAGGAFSVNENGSIAAANNGFVVNKDGNITKAGTISAADGTFLVKEGGTVSAAAGTFQIKEGGAVSAAAGTFEIKEEDLEGLTYQSISAWDSVGHMSLISSLENAFDIMFDTMDVIDFNSYEKGKEILSKEEYGVNFNE